MCAETFYYHRLLGSLTNQFFILIFSLSLSRGQTSSMPSSVSLVSFGIPEKEQKY